MKIFLKTDEEIELMREANLLVSKTLAEVGRHVKPGISTLGLDKLADVYIRDNGGIPCFKGYPNPYGKAFSGSICTSINSVIVHGIPNQHAILKEGDIISIDCGVLLNGYNGDSCYTFAVGSISDGIKQLLSVTKKSLYLGIQEAQSGHHTGDIGFAIQSFCETYGYGVVRELTGHGIGRSLHEDPSIPNYGHIGSGTLLKKGMCIAIEPMITKGLKDTVLLPDKWSIVTRDAKPAAHFEHTIAITDGKADILSSFEEIEKIEGQNF